MNVEVSLAAHVGRVKGFLGPSLKENPELEDLGTRSARAAGIAVEGGKLRCPDGAAGAGRFTDMQQTNCMIPLSEAERTASSAAKKAFSLGQGMVEFKAGLFHSHGRIGRAVQAAGSYVLPGNESSITHPVRSREGSAVTPSGHHLPGGRIGGARLIRCPAGYEHGGRFSPSDLSGCGRQLFVSPTAKRGNRATRAAEAASGSAREAEGAARRSAYALDLDAPGSAAASAISSRRGGRAVQIARQANIKPVGAASEHKRRNGIARALQSLPPHSRAAYLVRKDGSILNSVREADELQNVRMNRDMEGGALVGAAESLKGLGKSEIPLLLNTDISTVAWKLPDGNSLAVSRTDPLTLADKRRLGRLWKTGLSIPDFEAASHGAIQTEINVKDKTSLKRIWVEPVSGGPSRSVPVWVFENFLAEGAEGRIGKAWRIKDED